MIGGCSVLIEPGQQQCQVDADCQRLGADFAGSVCSKSLCVAPELQCQVDADCERLGEAFAGTVCQQTFCVPRDPLSCVPAVPSEAPTVKYNFAPIFANEPDDPKPFTIKACTRLDVNCDSPVAGPKQVLAGQPVDFDVPTGFIGYFEVKNPDTIPGLFFMGRAVEQDTLGWAITIPDAATIAGLFLATAQKPDPEAGNMIVIARDCDANPLKGATFENSAEGVGFYIVNGFPNPQGTKTTAEGSAGFANVPVGTTIVRASHESGTELTQVSLVIRSGWVAYAEVFP